MKFIKEHLASIDGIEIYPIISLSIFVLFFTGLIYWVWKMDKKNIKEVSDYPLQNN
ncbi:MAG: CcoQ/FixQ family Cbb3-type cytochrome c oxidase assembly chaperone [Flavobacteriales bacterium]|nr:CcoQ/FixQ family Cbb3-type cytochrome c oxidase assembly chaperone [Flavobacteriales bacterium]